MALQRDKAERAQRSRERVYKLLPRDIQFCVRMMEKYGEDYEVVSFPLKLKEKFNFSQYDCLDYLWIVPLFLSLRKLAVGLRQQWLTAAVD